MYGEAVLLQHCATSEYVVVKHIVLDDLSENEVKCALREVAALSAVEHPNIVKCCGSWVSPGADDESIRPWDRGKEGTRRPIREIVAIWAAARYGALGSPTSLNILTEYVDGGSLDTVIARNGPLDEMLIGTWIAQLVLAIDHMHQHNLLHRDIKVTRARRAESTERVTCLLDAAACLTC